MYMSVGWEIIFELPLLISYFSCSKQRNTFTTFSNKNQVSQATIYSSFECLNYYQEKFCEGHKHSLCVFSAEYNNYTVTQCQANLTKEYGTVDLKLS